MENKQTAVEWLEHELIKKGVIRRGFMIPDNIFKQAKEIEKEQIINAYIEESENFDDITKEIAEELVNKYLLATPVGFHIDDAKQCALIAVDEILNTLYSIPFGNALDNELEYWESVKQEIEKL